MTWQRSLIVALCGALAGCAVGPDFRPAPTPQAATYRATDSTEQKTATEPQRYVYDKTVPNQWWRQFQSAELDALVDKALSANPNIDSARAALRVAQENALAQRGAFWPQAGVAFTPSRQRTADITNSPINASNNPFSLHAAQLNITYSADVFGGNRRLVESLDAQAEAQRGELEAARLTLISNVVAAAIQEAALRAQIASTERMVALQTEILDLAHRQQAIGDISQAAVVAQATTLALTRATLPPLRKQLAQTRDLLIALTGTLPDRDISETFDLERLALPRELPVGQPSRLVDHRPDVRAAEAQAHAAAAQVGVAFAAMLPQFTVGADIGSVATQLNGLFKAGSGFWSVAGTAAQPLFQGGTLVHRKAAAEAAYDQALALYRATVITAFQNVADSLHALDQDAETLDATSTANQFATTSFALARRQFDAGDISHLGVLNAELAYQQTAIALIQARANRLTDTAALFQALGGEW